jgi:hypothetical protein
MEPKKTTAIFPNTEELFSLEDDLKMYGKDYSAGT